MKQHLGIACASFALALGAAMLAQEKGGGDETGPYDLVRGWPQNYCGEGHVIGSTAGIWAESPDRVYIFNRGCLPVVKDTRGAADAFIPARNASGYDLSQKDPARHPRWDHVFNVVDREGRLIESWDQHNRLFVRPHRILVNPYDPDRHVWLVDDGAHAIYKFTRDGKRLDLLVTDGGFRPDGTFVSWPAHDTARLTEAFRRAVLRLFVRLELFDEDQAAGMLTWPHSGFHVHTAVWVPEDDRAFATRLARYCARNPVALERLTYDRAAQAVTYRSDKSDGPTAGTETADPLEFLARVLVHIPDNGHVTTRYYGWYANRPRGMRRQAEPAAAETPPRIVPAPRLAPSAATRRWAALLQQIFEVDPLACPACHGAMRIVAFITQASVIDQILAHLRSRAAREAHAGPRSPPSTRAPANRGTTRAPRPSAGTAPVT